MNLILLIIIISIMSADYTWDLFIPDGMYIYIVCALIVGCTLGTRIIIYLARHFIAKRYICLYIILYNIAKIYCILFNCAAV